MKQIRITTIITGFIFAFLILVSYANVLEENFQQNLDDHKWLKMKLNIKKAKKSGDIYWETNN